MRYEAIVIGGGVMGCMAANSIVKRGMRNVLLLENGRLGNAASSQSAAMLMHQTQDTFLSKLAEFSIKYYKNMGPSVETETDLVRTGSVLVCKFEDEIPALIKAVGILEAQKIECRLVRASEISDLAPGIRLEDIAGGAYCPLDACLNPRGLIQELFKQSQALGVEVRQGVEVTHVRPDNGNGFVVRTNIGELTANRIINAAGSRAAQIAAWLGDTLPISLSKRHVFIFRPPVRPQGFPILDNITDEWYFRPSGRNILVGMGSVDVQGASDSYDFSEVARDPHLKEIAHDYLSERFPVWQDSQLETYWAGVRPITDDGVPIISRSEHHRGLFHCAGLSAYGMTTAPACAATLVSLVLDEKSPIEGAVEALCLTRFKCPPEGPITRPYIPETKQDGLSAIISSVPRHLTTPYYLYDLGHLRKDILELQSALSRFELLYSFKSNPCAAVIHTIADAGVGADVSSLTQLELALAAGLKPDTILFGGPGKTDADLCETILMSGCNVSIESANELYVMQAAAKKLNVRIPALIRINSSHRPRSAGEFMAGGPSQFGIDEEKTYLLKSEIDHDVTDVQGVHIHVASQILDHNAIIDHYTKSAQIAAELLEKLDQPLKLINFGGGLGVPYSIHERPLDFGKIAIDAISAIETVLGSKYNEHLRLQLELGRAMVANCGVFVTKIVDIKESRGRRFILVEAGITGFSRPAMRWAQPHKCWSIPERNRPELDYTIAGMSCLPADVLVLSAALNSPEIGDVICFAQAGAYGYTMSMLNWAGLKIPLEITHNNGNYSLVSDQQGRVLDSRRAT